MTYLKELEMEVTWRACLNIAIPVVGWAVESEDTFGVTDSGAAVGFVHCSGFNAERFVVSACMF
jgi:hypothetical protein